MRIDGPKGLGAWIQGWFSGSFKGNLEGTASYAETASYVNIEGVEGLEDTYLNKKDGGNVEGQLVLSGSVGYRHRLIVHGGIKVCGNISEGKDTDATEEGAHAEGMGSKALGVGSHAEGKNTRAIGVGSHAEGVGTKAIGIASHAEGIGTIAAGDGQLVVGEFNVPDASNQKLFIVGNGTSDEDRSNAFEINRDGTVSFGSGSAFEVPALYAEKLIIKSEEDENKKVFLEYQDETESVNFRFI